MTGRQSMTMILAVCLTVMLASLATLQGQQNGGDESSRIAVVNVDRVFNNLAERRAVGSEIQAQAEALQQEGRDRRQELEDLQEDFQLLAEGSDEATGVREQLEQKAVEFDVWQQVSQRRLETEQALRVGAIYRKINDTVEQIADREGYDLVLFDEDVPDFSGAQNQQQVAGRIQNRKVLYANDRLDISDRVLQRMNNAYESN